MMMETPNWTTFAKTSKQYFQLRRILAGIPQPWIEWAEKQTHRRQDFVEKSLEYRITVLWNGITLLQESKYLTDVVENTLRRCFVDFVVSNQTELSELLVPQWGVGKEKSLSLQYRNYTSSIGDFVAEHFSFYQLYGAMAANWLSLAHSKKHKPGFAHLFWGWKFYPDANTFLSDMKSIKNIRNDIAHSRRLFNVDEVKALYKITAKWLKPLDVDVADRIRSYRRQRPKFLRDLGI